jgi:hypothetical protein
MSIIYLFIVFSSCLVQARVLGLRQHFIRQELGYHSATGLWKSDEATSYGSGNSVDVYGAGTILGVGLGNKYEIDVNVQFTKSEIKYTGGGGWLSQILMMEKHKHLETFSEIGFRLIKQAYLSSDNSNDLMIYTGFKTPGDSYITPDSYVSSSDGITKFDFGLTWQWTQGDFGVSVDYRYTYRPGLLADISTLNVSLPYTLSQNKAVGVNITYLDTLGGYELSDPEFMMKGMPFSMKKEKFLFSTLYFGYVLSKQTVIDTGIASRFYGRNTDNGTSIYAGLTYYY